MGQLVDEMIEKTKKKSSVVEIIDPISNEYKEGRDAKLSGEDRESCPYTNAEEEIERETWLAGYDSADVR